MPGLLINTVGVRSSAPGLSYVIAFHLKSLPYAIEDSSMRI